MKPRMHLGFDFSYTHMGGRWRMPGAWPGRTFPDVAMYEDVARIAERGCLDHDLLRRWHRRAGHLARLARRRR